MDGGILIIFRGCRGNGFGSYFEGALGLSGEGLLCSNAETFAPLTMKNLGGLIPYVKESVKSVPGCIVDDISKSLKEGDESGDTRSLVREMR